MTFRVGDRVRLRFVVTREIAGEVLDPAVDFHGEHRVLVLWDDGVTSAALAGRLEPTDTPLDVAPGMM